MKISDKYKWIELIRIDMYSKFIHFSTSVFNSQIIITECVS